MRLASIMAEESERSGGGIAQSWINRFAASCADVILAADMPAAGGGDVERLRREALDQINHILARLCGFLCGVAERFCESFPEGGWNFHTIRVVPGH
jgi:hypothetical protein